MPFNIGTGELILIAVAALLIFGPKRLPEIGKAIGESIGALKKAMNPASPNQSQDENKTESTKASETEGNSNLNNQSEVPTSAKKE